MPRNTATRRPNARRILIPAIAALLAPLATLGCAPSQLREVASSNNLQWTGVAQAPDGRLFVNYPRWSDRYQFAVARVLDTATPSTVRPYPNAIINNWSPEGPGAGDWRERFVAVQSVHIDRQGRMWALDTGQVSEDAGRQAVIYEIDLQRDRIVRSLPLPFDVAPEGSYINDIRLTPDGRWGFISDSGLGAIIVLDTKTGDTRRVLADHPSTKGNDERIIEIDGRPLLVNETGQPPVIHCDGIDVSPDGQWVYYKAISADPLYRVPVSLLTDDRVPPTQLASAVEDLGTAPITDAIMFDNAGNLYFSALEENAIVYRTPGGDYKDLVRHRSISWPDSFAIDWDNDLLVFTTALIHRTPRFSEGETWPDEPYRVFTHPLAPSNE
ncbi:MAG: L-dopachrome tautomerase-related protein [Phycisphaerales bacterium]